MLLRDLRSWGLGALLALAAVPPSQGALVTGLSVFLAQGKLEQPRAIAALDDERFVLLDGGAGQRRLLCLQIIRGQAPTWDCTLEPCRAQLEKVAGLFAGTGGRFYLLQENGDLCRCRLRTDHAGHQLVPERTLVDAALRQAADLEGIQPHACAELPDGSLVLAYGWSLLHCSPPAGAEAKGEGSPPAWRWLVRPAGNPAAAEVPGLLVAVDGAGRVLVLDPWERKLTRRDLRTDQEEILATSAVWPQRDLLPVEAHASQDALYVAARFLGKPLRTLVVLEPSPSAGQGGSSPYQARLPFLGMDPRSTFSTSPSGHLLFSEPWAGKLRWVPDMSLPKGFEPDLMEGGAETFLDRVARCALKGQEIAVQHEAAPPAVKVPSRGPAQSEATAKADRAYQELMDQELVQEEVKSRAQAKRAKKKAYRQRRREQEAQAQAAATAPLPVPAGPASAAPEAAAAPPAPEPTTRANPAGPRPHSAPPVLEPAAAAAGKPKGGNPVVLQDAFLLGEEAVRRAARWMLEHADQGNPPRELAAWRLAGRRGDPRFSFGCYQRPDPDLRVLLQIRYLWAYARAIDGAAKDGQGDLLGRELAAAQGITGRLELADGSSLVTHGLEVIQDPDGEVLAIRPGGATRGECLPPPR